jgi:NADPH:quinone reductase-like Zn-dependent oxidoreductase
LLLGFSMDNVIRLKGVDLLLDVAGGDGINQSIAATKAGGRIAQIGNLTRPPRGHVLQNWG